MVIRKFWNVCLIGLMSISLANCSSDSDSSNDPNNEKEFVTPKEYVGLWELVSASSENTANDTTMQYNGEYITIIKENGIGAMQNGTYFNWKVDPETNLLWRNSSNYWIATQTTTHISESEWVISERITATTNLISTYRKISNPHPDEYIGKWNTYKVLKSTKAGIDTLDADWINHSEDVTMGNDMWRVKYITFKDDGTYINHDNKVREWLVSGVHIWGYDAYEWTDMIRVVTGVPEDRISFVILGEKESYRFYLKKAPEGI